MALHHWLAPSDRYSLTSLRTRIQHSEAQRRLEINLPHNKLLTGLESVCPKMQLVIDDPADPT